MSKKNVWNKLSQDELKKIPTLSEEYRYFLDNGKTERECINQIVDKIEEEGFLNIDFIRKKKKQLKPGDKIYSVGMNKTIALFKLGTEDIEKGMNILGAHIDSPRLDLKANPLYEDSGIAYFNTHYYGGIKKYQWVTIPLAIHGVVVKTDGTTIELSIGEDEDDPVFFISDLLIHLSQAQLEKKASKVIEGEALDLIIGSCPIKLGKPINSSSNENDENMENKESDSKEAVKSCILDILKKEYDIEEDDFLSAEIEIVPAGKAREAGLDRSMILAYGQDDRVCAYTALEAFLNTQVKKRTLSLILSDKEEIGSVGATGMHSCFYENSVAEIIAILNDYSDLKVRRCLANSNMLSTDVNSAYDPSYAGSFDKQNASFFGGGVVMNKYTGARGKSSSNDANAEYIAKIRRIFDKKDITYQFAEIGKVDEGGGGTIAYIMAKYGMNVIDSGVSVMSMHAPYEATSIVDIYETKRAYATFLEDID